jgi:hypothetical protein
LYLSLSAGVTRTFIRTLAGSLRGGLPLGLALVIGGIMYSQIILDKPLVRVLNVLTINKELYMEPLEYHVGLPKVLHTKDSIVILCNHGHVVDCFRRDEWAGSVAESRFDSFIRKPVRCCGTVLSQ